LLNNVWRSLQVTLEPVIRDVSQQEHRLELRGGGSVEMWSLDSADAGRGRAYSLAVIDEAALVLDLQHAWQETIRPMLADYRGEAWFLSTPRGFGYFKTLFDKGQDPDSTEWASWQMPTSTNPFIDPAEIEAAREDLSEQAFTQEYLAEFIFWEGCVFRRISEAAVLRSGATRVDGREYVFGVDWGKSTDFTVVVVIDTQARACVALDRFNKIDYSLQCARLRGLGEKWKPATIVVEQNSVGEVLIEQLRRDGVRGIRPFSTTVASKANAIESLALSFERSEIKIVNDAVLVSELLAFQAERLPSGLLRYGAPPGAHDDCVMALCLAWTQISGQCRMASQGIFDLYKQGAEALEARRSEVPAAIPTVPTVRIFEQHVEPAERLLPPRPWLRRVV
jgi:hypothetical protein